MDSWIKYTVSLHHRVGYRSLIDTTELHGKKKESSVKNNFVVTQNSDTGYRCLVGCGCDNNTR